MKEHITSLAPLAVLVMLACVEREITLGDSGESDEGVDAGSSAGVDCEGGEGTGAGDGDSTGDTGSGDCSVGDYAGEFIPRPYSEMPDWSNLSGLVNHVITLSTPGLSAQYVDARFYTTDYVDDSRLCIETIVEPTGVDSCWVWHSRGQGSGTETPDYWYDDLPVETVSFDVGDGPIALDFVAGTEASPSGYSAELPPPPAGVSFGGTATLVATFDGLPAVELDLDVPRDILPLGHALDTTTLSSEELASWTWATPGGDAPIKLEVSLGATPVATGWMQVVRIQCEVTDDGEFAFPAEYLDLARERLGPELHASSSLTREATGTTMLAGKLLLWRSNVTTWLATAVVD